MLKLKYLSSIYKYLYYKLLSPFFTNKNKYLKQFSIGNYTYGSPFVSFEDSCQELRIGKYCSIGKNVHFYLGGGIEQIGSLHIPSQQFLNMQRNVRGILAQKAISLLGMMYGLGMTRLFFPA